VSASLGSAANPYAYPVPAAANDSIRALVFDAAQNPQVGFRIDSGTTWYPMTRVAAGSPLWQGAWDASALAAGTHTVEVRAVGTATKSHVITVSVTAAGNRPPVAANDGYTATSGTALVVAAPGVLANDADPDGNLIHAALVAGPQHGTLLLNADGSFTYTSAANFSGADAFTYAANDGTLTSGTATVTITVNPAQQGDTVTIKSATYARRTKTLAVTATSSAQPNATLTLVGYGQMTYSTKTKSYSLSVKTATAPSSVMVSSSLGGSKTASVTVK
jgi:VCBS repeat-containing protein